MSGRAWMGFGLLCVLSGSGWILDERWTSPLTGLARSAVHEVVLALIFGVVAGMPRKRWSGGRQLWQVALWGAVLVALPQVVIAGAGGRVSSFTAVLVFTLVPAIVVILEAQEGRFGNSESSLTKLGPAIAGVAGAALILPFGLPESVAGRVWLAGLVASAVLAGVAATRLHGLVRKGAELGDATVICATCAVICGLGAAASQLPVRSAGLRDWWIELAVCLVVDGPVILLLVWLVREVHPVAFAARYLLIPAITVVEGFVLLRPPWSWTQGLGLALLFGGSALLVRQPENLA